MNHTAHRARMEKCIEIDEGYARHVNLGLGALEYVGTADIFNRHFKLPKYRCYIVNSKDDSSLVRARRTSVQIKENSEVRYTPRRVCSVWKHFPCM